MNRIRVFVIDDDREILQVIRRTLELEGYVVEVASGGEIGIANFQKWNPDLILLDIMMPGADGYQVLQQIRQRSVVPVVMLTSLDEVAALEKSVDLGADGYITKPFRSGELVARVRAVLRRSRLKPH